MDAITDKWVPISLEAEQGLLGALLVNNHAMNFISDVVVPDHFGEALHGYLFETMKTLIDAGKVADPITLMKLIPDQMLFEGMSTRKYLARLAAEATTIINARDYAMMIRDLAKQRELMLLADDIKAAGPCEILDLASSSIERIDSIVAGLSNSTTRGMPAAGMMAAAVDAAAKAYQAEGRILGLPSGLTKLDRKLLGFTAGDLVVIAGRPGMGKSALMVSGARHMGELGHHGILFSQEMSEVALGQRMISDALFNSGPINYFSFRSGRFDERAFTRVAEAAERLALLPLRIEPAPSQTVSQIAAKARQAKRRGKLSHIWVDHLQIMQPSGEYQSRNDQIGEITSALKALAKELNIVVFLLSQLSRNVETRDNKRPMMSDLRDSGNIEQDADVVIMLFREMYYLERREPPVGTPENAVWQTACHRANNKLEIIVEKQRAGPTGTVEVFCNIACNAVRDLDEHEVLPTAAIRAPGEDGPILL